MWGAEVGRGGALVARRGGSIALGAGNIIPALDWVNSGGSGEVPEWARRLASESARRGARRRGASPMRTNRRSCESTAERTVPPRQYQRGEWHEQDEHGDGTRA